MHYKFTIIGHYLRLIKKNGEIINLNLTVISSELFAKGLKITQLLSQRRKYTV